MPWRECNRMEERLRFVARLLEGEKMAVLCREFGSPARPGTRSTIAKRILAARVWCTAPAVLTGTPTSWHFRSRPRS